MISDVTSLPKRRPCREQNLLISTSKHLYLTKNDFLRHQQKPIDPRVPGSKTLLTRLVLLDVDTGSIYGEMQCTGNEDLLGFLARAWSIKPLHPMHGIPTQLNIPKSATDDEDMIKDLRLLASGFHFNLAPLPTGFSAGIHAVKQFEIEVQCLLSEVDQDVTFDLITACAAIISHRASSGLSFSYEHAWNSVPAPDGQFTAFIDAQYKQPGSWRLGAHELVLSGVPAARAPRPLI